MNPQDEGAAAVSRRPAGSPTVDSDTHIPAEGEAPRVRRPVLPLLFAALPLAALLLAAPAAGHAVNFAGLDPQVAAEGTVYVEAVFVEAPGWVALYADGSPAGHARVETAGRTVNDVAVDVDAAAFDGEEPVTLAARLFADDGDGAFEPDADDPLEVGNATVATTVDTLRNGNEESGREETGSDDAVTTATDDASSRTGGASPGFALGGGLAALVALVAVAAVVARETERL